MNDFIFLMPDVIKNRWNAFYLAEKTGTQPDVLVTRIRSLRKAEDLIRRVTMEGGDTEIILDTQTAEGRRLLFRVLPCIPCTEEKETEKKPTSGLVWSRRVFLTQLAGRFRPKDPERSAACTLAELQEEIENPFRENLLDSLRSARSLGGKRPCMLFDKISCEVYRRTKSGTTPPAVLKKLFTHPLTDVLKFLIDDCREGDPNFTLDNPVRTEQVMLLIAAGLSVLDQVFLPDGNTDRPLFDQWLRKNTRDYAEVSLDSLLFLFLDDEETSAGLRKSNPVLTEVLRNTRELTRHLQPYLFRLFGTEFLGNERDAVRTLLEPVLARHLYCCYADTDPKPDLLPWHLFQPEARERFQRRMLP
jgi:hypothetical protein